MRETLLSPVSAPGRICSRADCRPDQGTCRPDAADIFMVPVSCSLQEDKENFPAAAGMDNSLPGRRRSRGAFVLHGRRKRTGAACCFKPVPFKAWQYCQQTILLLCLLPGVELSPCCSLDWQPHLPEGKKAGHNSL